MSGREQGIRVAGVVVERLVLEGFEHLEALRVRDGFSDGLAALAPSLRLPAHLDGLPDLRTAPAAARDGYAIGRAAAQALLERLASEGSGDG